jgi:hypothetical protein
MVGRVRALAKYIKYDVIHEQGWNITIFEEISCIKYNHVI